jgi:hypothetical protein
LWPQKFLRYIRQGIVAGDKSYRRREDENWLRTWS